MEAADMPACDGWMAWRIGGSDGELLHQVRVRLSERLRVVEEETSPIESDSAP